MELKIEYLSREEIRPYEGNAKKHPREQIDQIKSSIEQFGFNDPVAIWKDNVVIEGHGRLLAAAELGMDRIPVIRLDDLTDEQRKAYALVHNKLTMNTDFDIDILETELDGIDMDLSEFGFSNQEMESLEIQDFKEYGEDIETKHKCPKCGYEWN